MSRIFIPIIFLFCIASCKPKILPPKPPGYYKIDTPAAHQYRLFDKAGYPYTFEYPVYAEVVPDSAFLEERADNPYWVNIFYPTLGGIINFTYKEINTKQSLGDLIRRAYDLSFFHHDKAKYIDNEQYDNGAKVYVATYSLGGDAASKYQFTATDSTKHFIRGALYFDVTPNADSLQPAYDFIERDIQHMLMTMRWR